MLPHDCCGSARKSGGDLDRRRGWAAAVLLTLAVVAIAQAAVWWGAWRSGYALFGDAAVIALRSGDVFGAGAPVLGMPSAFSSWSNAADPMHPGPAMFWMLAPTVELLGGLRGALVGTWLISITSVAAVVLLTTRRIGPVGAPLGATLGLAAIRLGPPMVWEPVNTTAAVPLCVVVAIAVWTVLDADDRGWPVLVVSASIVLQLDLSFMPSTLLLLLAAVVATAVRWRRFAPGPEGRRERLRVICLSSGLGLVLWVLPIAESIVNGGGNIAEGIRALGADVPVRGLPAVVRAMSIAFLPAVITCPFLFVAWRSNRPARRALLITGAVAGMGAAIGQGLVPAGPVNSLVWIPLVGNSMVVWFAALTIAGEVIVRMFPQRTAVARLLAWTLFLAVAFRFGSAPISYTPWGGEYFGSLEPLGDVVQRLPPGNYRLQPLGGPMGVATALGVMQEVDGSEVHLRVEEPLARYVGRTRLVDGDERSTLYLVVGMRTPPVSGAELAGRWRSDDFDQEQRQRIDELTAARVSASPVAWSPTASTFFVGSIAASTAHSRTHSYGSLVRLGDDLMAGRRDVRELPAEVIAELVVQNQLLLHPGDDELLEQLRASRGDQLVTAWVAE